MKPIIGLPLPYDSGFATLKVRFRGHLAAAERILPLSPAPPSLYHPPTIQESLLSLFKPYIYFASTITIIVRPELSGVTYVGEVQTTLEALV